MRSGSAALHDGTTVLPLGDLNSLNSKFIGFFWWNIGIYWGEIPFIFVPGHGLGLGGVGGTQELSVSGCVSAGATG